MTNIIAFPKQKPVTQSISLEIETMMLEDESFWYRYTDIRPDGKTSEWSEWVLLERQMNTKELFKGEPRPKQFVCTRKVKNLVVADIGLEGFKNEVRCSGFDVIYVMDNITGPVLEEIWL